MAAVLELASGTQLVEGTLQVIGIDAASAVKGSGRQSIVGDAVDLARQAAGGVAGQRRIPKPANQHFRSAPSGDAGVVAAPGAR